MTELAQEVIEREMRERTGYLDLGNCGLTELPDLSGMDWLETLIVANSWWDINQGAWVLSNNKGEWSIIIKPPSHPLPLGLKKVVFGGGFSGKWAMSDFGFLANLANLTSLDLHSNEISDLGFLANLTNLTSLDLSSNQMNDLGVLGNLVNLTTLNLTNNEISDFGFLSNLLNLTSLNLSFTETRDIGFLANLRNLTSLNLRSNEIIDLGFLKNLTNLTSLNLNANEIRDFGFLANLRNLTRLVLSSNENIDLNFLDKITKLTSLYLSSNEIIGLGVVANLTNLISLNLSSSQSIDLGFLKNLTNLTSLDLRSNEIIGLGVLANLTRLTSLDLTSIEISDLGFLANLTNLTSLYLDSDEELNGLGFLANLKNLNTLYLTDNQISELGFLANLTNLTMLNLSSNHISDITPLLPLIRKGIPVTMDQYRFNVINLHGNPLQNPPPEIVQQGNEAILEYFRQKEKTGAKPLLEAKLVLLGDGRAGKTSLANRLLGKELPKQEDRTQGVDIVIGEYQFPVAEGDFKLHIWDFAGQDKYKPLHQFFYTEGAVYVMVADSGNALTDYNDWFQTAETFGEGSPLVLALNEFREGIGMGTFDEERWRKQFPKLLKEVHLVNLLSEKGVPQLEKCLQYYADLLPHAKTDYPTNWADIRSELERRRSENYISREEFFKICRENNLPERSSALILSGILHKIGVCLHYQKSELLQQYVILKNEWATHAVYQILEDTQVAEVKKGFFDWDDLRRIWSDDSYADMRPQLLELMQQFKMAYPLPNGKEFVTPPLLPAAPPEAWDLPEGHALEMFVEYKFLPKALMTQFIVSRHADIDKGRTLVWRNGVVLRWSADTVAEIKIFKSRGRDALYIRSQGIERRGLLTAILKTLRELHSDYSGIVVLEVMPCPCEGCRNKNNPQHFFEFRKLANWWEKGHNKWLCDESSEEVDLRQLLLDNFVFDSLTDRKPVILGRAVSLKRADSPSKAAAPRAFFSYSKADGEHLKTFQKHLRPLERSGKIELWDDRKILPGEEWDESIREALATADIIFLLLSPDFLATDYVVETEIAEAMRRHEAGEARVIPIKLRPCSWKDTPFKKLQGIPRKDIIISTASDKDSAWLAVLLEIEALISEYPLKLKINKRIRPKSAQKGQ